MVHFLKFANSRTPKNLVSGLKAQIYEATKSNISFSLTGVNVPKSRTYYMVYVFVMYFMRLVCFRWMGKLRHNQEIWS